MSQLMFAESESTETSFKRSYAIPEQKIPYDRYSELDFVVEHVLVPNNYTIIERDSEKGMRMTILDKESKIARETIVKKGH